ncbi:DUF6049 family protein [Nocardioides hwasunensis]|uniref:Secreted protein n=1 Tax=Nocardioides hwasunensis TaxID=397258 RepID=A0ABR8MJV4_9ACTN|nr:DUF6049 family protein [Nocardioides hwasunensis]MBD3916283.1 hypothetical protein [Nocardioides hwasunensis]
MPRLTVIRAVLAGLLTVGLASAPALATPAAAAPDEPPDPLVVHLDTITPVLPRTGSVEITGTVTNVSDETFTRINLHAFSSSEPILTSPALAASAAVSSTEYVGERVTVPGTFFTVDTLEPGETADFSDSVPVDLLDATGDPGVYWIGVHALGDTPSTPRDAVADGRARTFIPARPKGNQVQEASVVLSIRGRVWFDEDGSIGGTERWARRLAEGGSLDGVLEMAESAGGVPYSFLVDPAVLWAVTRLANGNPPRSLEPDPNVPDQVPTETPTDDTGTASGQPTPTEAPSDEDAALATAAAAWVSRFQALAATRPVLALPFGDLDVSAAMRHDATRYPQAVARSIEVMTALSLPSVPTVAPGNDLISPEALAQLPEDTTVLLGDNAFGVRPDTSTSVVRLLGHKVVVTSTGAEAGGPGPTAATDPLALRQRLLSEAALRLVEKDTAPLVVALPTVWRGEDATSFFADLEQSWLELVPVTDVADRSATGLPADRLTYTEADAATELDASSFFAATRASDTATLMESVLSLQTTIEAQTRDEVLVTLSEQHRRRPGQARAGAERVTAALRADLARIRIEAPTAVTLSSDSGPLGATLVNDLDQPVEVQVEVTTDGGLILTGGGTRTLRPSARSVLRYEATATQPGVHKVRLAVTSVDGVPLGSTDQLPIRAARVSALIWIAMAAGALVLFGMIGYRLPGQIRARRAELAAADRLDLEDAADPAPDAASPDRPGGALPERP